MLKHYIEWLTPGFLMANECHSEISSRESPDISVLPRNAFAYRTFSREEVVSGGEVLVGEPKDFSHYTYFGEVFTLEQVKAWPGNNRIMITNMECNGWDRVVRTIMGNVRPLEDGDQVVTP